MVLDGLYQHPVAAALLDEFTDRKIQVTERSGAGLLIAAVAQWADSAAVKSEPVRFALMAEKLRSLRDCVDAAADRIDAEFDT